MRSTVEVRIIDTDVDAYIHVGNFVEGRAELVGGVHSQRFPTEEFHVVATIERIRHEKKPRLTREGERIYSIEANIPRVIVVSTANFEVYHDLVGELRERDVRFTTIEPGTELPEDARVAIVGPEDEHPSVRTVRARPDRPRLAVDEALSALRGWDGRTVVGIDPGDRPGIAVLSGETIVSAFQVPAEEVASVIDRETSGAADPLVRIGDGARLKGASIVDEIEEVPIELVDETGTTPYQGTGVRGMGDVLAAVNIARLNGKRIESRKIEPTAGEIRLIQNRSREESRNGRSIDEFLARRVALGELSMAEALRRHRGE